MLKIPTLLLLLSSPLFAIDALSPVEGFLGGNQDSEDYEDRDLGEQKRFAPFSPSDSDLGDQLILKRYSQREPVRAHLSANVFWTDNTGSTRTNKDDGFIWRARAAASWKPRIGNNLFAKLSAEQSIYRYDSPSFLNFERTDLRVGLVKIVPDFYDILFFARYEYSRITSGSLSDGVYSTQRVRLGAHKVFLSTSKHTAYLALDAAYGFSTTPSRLERNEYAAHLGYTYRITDRLRAVCYYHYTYYDYDQGGRRDINHVLGAELQWQLNKNTTLSASALHVENDSNLPFGGADYTASQAGLGIGLKLKF
ncbi:MAG: outer membrane beta-barrel protein [Akkermansiaceae bacterium]